MTTGSAQPRRGMTPYPSPNGSPRFLSDVIIELGLAEEHDVNQAVEDARQSQATVGQILVQQGRLSDDDLARALAARYGLNYVDLNEFEVDHEAVNLLPLEVAKRCAAMPVAFEPDGSLLVAMADPSDSLGLSDIEFMTQLDVQPAVAAANLIADLAAHLPLRPDEPGGSRFHVATAATAPAQAAEPPPTQLAPTPRPVPSVDTAQGDRRRGDRRRAQPDRASAALDSKRSNNAHMVADLSSPAAGDEHRAELDALQAQQGAIRAELESLRADRDAVRSDLDAARVERDTARAERETAHAERDTARRELTAALEQLDTGRGELESVRAALEAACVALERATSDAQANRDAAKRTAEAERRVAELEDVEQQAEEAHSTIEKMRTEFQLERDGFAAAERDLRGRLASVTEQHEALQDAHDAEQTRAEVLSAQNAVLLDAVATAKNWSAEIARGARELASSLENAALDGTAHAEPVPRQDTLQGFTPAPADAQPSNYGDALPSD